MTLTRHALLSLVALATAAAGPAFAATFQIGTVGDSQSWSIYGQSFTPSISGEGFSTPSGLGQVNLLSISFAQFFNGTAPASVLIVETSLLADAADLPATLGAILADPASYVLGESSAATTTGGLLDGQFAGTYNTHTYTFTDGVTLDANTSYTALFSDGERSLRVIGAGPGGGGHAYAGGSILEGDGFDVNYDAGFIATFAPIPEPSVCALLGGLGALGLGVIKRRRR